METIEVNGYRIEIEPDYEPVNPREWGNFDHMVCSHGRYSLGDEQLENHGENFEDDLKHHLADKGMTLKDILVLPLYIYDHSGICMNTIGYSCNWDSGQVGFIYVTKEDVRKGYNIKRITQTIKEKALELLKGEVETYSKYLEGDVWYVSIYEGEELIDCCGGIYGFDYAKEDAISKVNGMTRGVA